VALVQVVDLGLGAPTAQAARPDRFIAHLLARNLRIEEDLIDRLFNSTEQRLARTLLLLARYGKPDATIGAILRSSQKTLGGRLDRIKYLCEARADVSQNAAGRQVIAEAIRRESVAYLALVDARRGGDRRQDPRCRLH
jgi:hypothetical protein